MKSNRWFVVRDYLISAKKFNFSGSNLSLRENFGWNLLGDLVYASCQWGMIVVLTKMTSTVAVGQFALALAVTAPVFLFSQLQLRGVQATDAKNEYSFVHYLGLRLITTVLAMSVVMFIAFYYYEKKTAFVILAVGVAKVFESVSDVLYGLMQKNERMDCIAISKMTKGFLSLMTLALLVYLTKDLFWGVIGMAGVWGSILWTFDLRYGKRILAENEKQSVTYPIKSIFNFDSLRKLVCLAFPLGIVLALLSLNANIPRYFVVRFFGMAELGIFAALAYLVVIGSMIINAMGQSVTPRLANYYVGSEISRFWKLFFRLLLIGGGVGLLGVGVAYFAGDIALRLIYSEEYSKRQDIFIWIMVAGAITWIGSLFGYGVTAARIFKIQIPISLAAVCSTLVASYLLIPTRGLQGCVESVLIGNAVIATLYGMVLTAALRKRQGN